MDTETLGAALALMRKNAIPETDITWEKGKMIGSAGITNSVSMALSNIIPCSGGDILNSSTPYTDANNVWLVYYIGEYNESGFLRRREVSKAGNVDKWPVTLSPDVTYIYVSFGGYGSRGAITDEDIATYADLHVMRAPVNVSVFNAQMNQVTEKLAHSEARRNLKLLMFGDSITWGSVSGAQTPYGLPYWVSTLLGVETVNLGVGGQGWVCPISEKTGLDAVKEADYTGVGAVTLAYGINDSSYTLGTYLDTEPITVMGAIYGAVTWLAAQHPDVTVILLSPTNTSNKGSAPRWRLDAQVASGSYTGQEMVDEYKKFADYYGIQFINCSNSGPLHGLVLPTLLSDNVHPSELGYMLLGRYLAAQLSRFI